MNFNSLKKGFSGRTPMTTHQDYKVWQDVYKSSFKGIELYIKFQQDSHGYFTIGFKEL